MLFVKAAIPLHHQLFSVVKQRIEEGYYPSGHRLPPEDALAREWSVSRATVRQAMADLDRFGYVDRRQGSGTFVTGSERPTYGLTLTGSLDDLITATRSSLTIGAEIERSVEIPAGVASRLGLEEPIGSIIRRRRDDESGQPYGYLVNYLSDDLSEDMALADLTDTTLLELLERRGQRVLGAEQSIRARVADVDVAEALGIHVGEPVLTVERLVRGEDDRALELLHSYYRSDVYEYRVHFTR
jgi:GntR family transcriptional regulator